MEPISLKAFLQNPSTKSMAEIASKLSKELGLVELVSFYLEDDLLKSLIKRLDSRLEDLYKSFSNDRDKFIQNAINRLGGKTGEGVQFPYYATPETDVVVTFVENNSVPAKVMVKEGKMRLTFVPYESYASLEGAIARQGEDDIVATFRDGKVVNLEKKRNIFIENKSVDALMQGPVALNFYPMGLTLFSSVLAMNLKLSENRVKVTRNGEELRVEILEGKASPDEVLAGDTLSPRSKASLYYDYKKKTIFRNEIVEALASKLI
ncbi:MULTISPECIES: hypothetical protein [Metallosphaera]|uniref:Uncharacterized protein n=3 Tax=Metallosphaera TaxID=41980 RepID=A4YE51_METS5|nr:MULTISPECIES: hypothetical protein [Metallosphaera]ABP94703.1 hypothetical protein Msed_0528 [Metallosphaera sedula DSM 5348]AIM26690.1 hypothetical protein HA72_0528 [Metallosphaera sedula]AKV73652.1 hypothetical protein MsedA_0540 [Metallosphaera sedula]AKV75892.1 hypothetical protein MsedB_0540 [Metallosphaera sedula]AKV78143.1 hypothetical protein MsedC_0539 [Metallosphaera sedula]